MSTYIVQVSASSALDAIDMARRRANDDGYRVVSVKPPIRVAPPVPVRWSVHMEVTRG